MTDNKPCPAALTVIAAVLVAANGGVPGDLAALIEGLR